MEPARQPKPPNFLNVVDVPVLERVEHSPDFRRVPFDSRYGLEIFENSIR